MAETTESPMRKTLTVMPSSSEALMDASLRAFQGFSIP